MALPIMRKATAVWLVDNTTLTFEQIANFTGMHELEIQGIADGDVASGVKGFDPIVNNQLTAEMIAKAEADPSLSLTLKAMPNLEGEGKRKGPRYTPLSKRQDKPAAIAWLVKNHPEIPDSQISKLVGTTKPTIQKIRDRTHWNMANIVPVDPVALGLCSQTELDQVIIKAAKVNPTPATDVVDDLETLTTLKQGFATKPNPELSENSDETLDPESLFR